MSGKDAPAPAAAAAAAGKDGKDAAPSLQDQAKEFYNKLDAWLLNFPIAKQAQEKTGQQPALLACCVLGVTALIILVMNGMDALCNLVGFGYPVYASYKALATADGDDDTHWLTYWVVFGTFSTVEEFTDVIFESSGWSSIYFLLKISFLMWCFLPQTQGANIIYHRVIARFLIQNEETIDRGVNTAAATASAVGDDAKAAATQHIAEAAMNRLAAGGHQKTN